MIMFRVLSEAESKNVTRWHAPDLGADASKVANTRQQANPRQPDSGDAEMHSLLGGLELKRDSSSNRSSAPRLQSISPIDVLASHMSGQTSQAQASQVSAAASAQMLQSSYDEGYGKGFAAGATALHQQTVQELKAVIMALGVADNRQNDNELEDELVALSVDIARLVIQKEMSIDQTIIQNIVSTGLEQLPGHSMSSTRVNLHPVDAGIVRDNMGADAEITIIEDPTLQRGACNIESGASIVKAGVDDWLVNISEQLGLNVKAETQRMEPVSQLDDKFPTKSRSDDLHDNDMRDN